MGVTVLTKSRAGYLLAVLAAPVLLPIMLSARAQAAIVISVSLPPPELPVYEQPPAPAPDYLWVPGYWAWDAGYGYYWVPGTWVLPPQSGLYWTPGYWAYNDGGLYIYHAGYWGPYVGFYGGVNYGFGYFGHGFAGGYWEGGHFRYNEDVWHVGDHDRFATYRQPVEHFEASRVSFNGGEGIHAAPTPQELSYAHMRVSGPTSQQLEHRQDAGANPEFHHSFNQGNPPVAASPRASQFEAPNTVRAQGAQEHTYRPEAYFSAHAQPAVQPHVQAQPQYHSQPAMAAQPQFQHSTPQPHPQGTPHAEAPHPEAPHGGGEHRDEGGR